MGLFIRQNDDRSELQRRLAAELQEKAKARAELENKPSNDINDLEYMKDTKQTTSLAWAWILIVVLIVGAIILISMRAAGQI
jgi:hypothetical protein